MTDPSLANLIRRYRDKRVCVTGRITNFRGTPEVAASDSAEIKVQK